MPSRKSVSLWLAMGAAAWANMGIVSAQQQQVFISEPTGVNNNWSTAPILTRGETVPLLDGVGNFSWDSSHAKFDGLGAYRFDTDTLTRLCQSRE